MIKSDELLFGEGRFFAEREGEIVDFLEAGDGRAEVGDLTLAILFRLEHHRSSVRMRRRSVL